ncbi:MAG: SDR family oxidoreductase [Gemmatimonadales bacterium]|jgi:NADP-dependent 3-hydroxy acid dehydrogenase YdfG
MSELAGRVALVTGASRGIGRVIADRLEDAGAIVVGLARTLEAGRRDRRLDVPCDVTDEAAIDRAKARVLEEVGPPHILVNNAGVFLLHPLVETTRAQFDGQLAGNVVGPFLVLRAFLPHVEQSHHTHLVTIGSVADHRPYAGNAAYAASKHAVRGLHDVVVEEVRGTGIRTTLISPGPTDTKLWDTADPDASADLPARSSMLLPIDVANAVLYAVSQPPRVNVEWIRVMPAGG